MAKRRLGRPKDRIEAQAEVLSSNPFAALRGDESADESADEAESSGESGLSEIAAPEPKAPAQPGSSLGQKLANIGQKIVVRREKKGHAGKTVTVIEGLPLPAQELDELAKLLRKALGCGGRVNDGRVVLTGERQAQVAAWLRGQGLRKIVIGN